ncbi:zinc finger AN1 domain-containing stress-associated protein 12 [Andrographis paniculata]|uniref:zinc finger AN1 domain-containing stress-associated protein 12 n=1 Tax=Andrographis paniculata TaxID=175694 RepID=UPI0021E85B6A|nr:zinc finger AN1 domain-containing stress-associated protein 12 [Andrographis paniculata]XP_051141469.1 zinc finger AN1 domain-containing stress-associated protein 12 [Andrographis paniculata]
MERGTEAFPDLGSHCQHLDCRQLDFLPFTCNACRKVFCLEHRSYKAHECPNSEIGSRKVLVCEICSYAIETTGQDEEEEKKILEKHSESGDCDPKNNKKPKCPVRRCKEVLTFSNVATCKSCRVRICLKHRFPADHSCAQLRLRSATNPGKLSNNNLLALRTAKDCGDKIITGGSNPPPSVKAW